MRTRVHAFFLGGTIALPTATGEEAPARLGHAELVGDLPAGLRGDGSVEVVAVDLLKVGSAHLRFDDVLDVLRAAERAVADGAAGVVVVQGTDSIEETAYLLDLLWRHDAPLVLTGAMRRAGLPGADGPANLAAAVTVAAATSCRGLGALVVLNDEVHAARHVTKWHTSLPSAFTSPNGGPVARMLEGEPALVSRPRRLPPIVAPDRLDARVLLLTACLDDDPRFYEAAGRMADGLVVAAFGAGHLPTAVADVLGGIAVQQPVVLASRVGAGAVHRRSYRGPGSETDLLDRGLIRAGHLSAPKARLLLCLLLATRTDLVDIAARFEGHGAAGP